MEKIRFIVDRTAIPKERFSIAEKIHQYLSAHYPENEYYLKYKRIDPNESFSLNLPALSETTIYVRNKNRWIPKILKEMFFDSPIIEVESPDENSYRSDHLNPRVNSIRNRSTDVMLVPNATLEEMLKEIFGKENVTREEMVFI